MDRTSSNSIFNDLLILLSTFSIVSFKSITNHNILAKSEYSENVVIDLLLNIFVREVYCTFIFSE